MIRVVKEMLATGLILLTLTFFPITASNHSSHKLHSEPGSQTTEVVELHVTVTGKKDAFVDGLQENNFEILIDKKSVRIQSFRNQDSPASIGIIVDSSGSMSWLLPGKQSSDSLMVQEALRQFVKRGHPNNEYFLIAFNRRPQLLADLTSDPVKLVEAFNSITLAGNSAFYDACFLGIDKLQEARHAKRVLVLLTDGQDNSSKHTFNELRERLRTTGVIVYSLHLLSAADGGSSLGREGKEILRDFSEVSGGAIYPNRSGSIYPTPGLMVKEISSHLGQIADELRHQYSMTIFPDQLADTRKWRKIKTVVKSDSATVKLRTRTREGFYSGKPKTDYQKPISLLL